MSILEGEKTETQERWSGEYDWIGAATKPRNSWGKEGSPPGGLEGVWPCQNLDFVL